MIGGRFGTSSNRHLASVHPSVSQLFRSVVADFDCSILCGARSKEAQNRAFESGVSHTSWPNSRHNVRPADPTENEWDLPKLSRAVDVFPIPEAGWPIRTEDWDDTPRFYYFAGLVWARAEQLHIPIRWGGNWDGDSQLRDQTLFDLVHWELK